MLLIVTNNTKCPFDSIALVVITIDPYGKTTTGEGQWGATAVSVGALPAPMGSVDNMRSFAAARLRYGAMVASPGAATSHGAHTASQQRQQASQVMSDGHGRGEQHTNQPTGHSNITTIFLYMQVLSL